jgi:hypothetical protein
VTRWGVFKKALERWRLFKEIEVGHRFQTRYHSHRRRRERGLPSKYGRIFQPHWWARTHCRGVCVPAYAQS